MKQLKENQIKLRTKEQIVRNCTQIDRNIVNEIVLKLFKILLNNYNDDESFESDNKNAFQNDNTEKDNNWNAGKYIEIIDLIKHLSENELRILKSECGGLKTLLKNKHEIFVINGNTVSIRKPQIKEIEFLKEKIKLKKRKCFFYDYHPDGCPLKDDECTFIHEKNL